MKLTIIGAGPGGYSAAFAAAEALLWLQKTLRRAFAALRPV